VLGLELRKFIASRLPVLAGSNLVVRHLSRPLAVRHVVFSFCIASGAKAIMRRPRLLACRAPRSLTYTGFSGHWSAAARCRVGSGVIAIRSSEA
jgi:hypothetical protein